MKIEDKVIAFLIQQEQQDLKVSLQELSKISWSQKNKPIIAALKEYLKISTPSFNAFSYVQNQFEDKTYLSQLATEESAYVTFLGKQNIEKLISTQEESILKNTLLKLKDKPTDKVLSDIKKLKGLRPIKPLNLDQVKEKRIIDRGFESISPSTGYKSLDLILKGFVSGHVYTMTGETNIGKTMVACNFAYGVAKQKKSVLYFALEPDMTVIEYLASIWSRKRFVNLTEEDLTPQVEIDVYTKEQVATLEDMVRIVENSKHYDFIVIDHFGYFITDGKNSLQAEKNSMKTIASLSKQNNTAILAIVHPRKPVGQSKKQRQLSLHDLSGSAAFSQDATDVLVIARRKDEMDPLGIKYTNEGYIAVHKTKSGPNGVVPVYFMEGSALIVEEEEYARFQSNLF